MQCKKCGYQNSQGAVYCAGCGHKLGHAEQPQIPTMLLAAIVVVLLIVVGYSSIHNWSAATCTEAAVCTICGKTGDKALGHNWSAANCTEAASCTICGATKNTALGHSWKSATCTSPETCVNCGQTRGEKLGHTWTAATFTTAKTCTTCNTTDGQPLSYKSISVVDECKSIGDKYKIIEQNRKDKLYRTVNLRSGVDALYDRNGKLACVIVYRGTSGIGSYSEKYSRMYYFDNGKLIFAFFEGDDSHRLYFYQEQLMRWRYTSTTGKLAIYDFDFSQDYYMWEELALNEVKTFY